MIFLSDEQINKLSWNRIKNIMAPIRAKISCYKMEQDDHFDIVDQIIKQQQAKVLAPYEEYFNKLKLAASKLPHEERKKRKGSNRNH